MFRASIGRMICYGLQSHHFVFHRIVSYVSYDYYLITNKSRILGVSSLGSTDGLKTCTVICAKPESFAESFLQMPLRITVNMHLCIASGWVHAAIPVTINTSQMFVSINTNARDGLWYRISSNNSRERLFFFSHQKGAIIRGKAIIS